MPAPARPAVPLALAALSGVVLGGPAATFWPQGALAAALVAALLALGAALRRSVALLLLAVFLLGLARRLDAQDQAPLLFQGDDLPALVKGHVASEPRRTFGGVTELVFDVEAGWTGPGAWSAAGDSSFGPGERAEPGLRLHARLAPEVRRRAGDLLPGRRLELAGRLRAAREPVFEDAYSERGTVAREGAVALLDVERAWKLDGGVLGSESLVSRLGRRARSSIRSAGLARDEEAIVRGVVLGDRQGLSLGAVQAFRATNMVHALTVSGVHVAILAWLLGTLVKPLPAGLRGLLVAAGLVLYLLVAGPNPGALRATVAGGVLAVAQGWGRGGDSWNRLAVALLVVLAYDPASVEDVGFQLTFGTVAGILALSPPLQRALGGGPIRRAFATSLAAFVAHGPLLVARFGQLSLVGVVANVPALPLTEATLALGLGGTGLGLVHPALGRPLLLLAGLAARALLALVEVAALLPPLAVSRPTPLVSAVALGLCTLGITFKRKPLLASGALLFVAGMVPPSGPVAPAVIVLPHAIRLEGKREVLGQGVYRLEHGASSALVLDDPGGRELGRVLARVPEGKLRASVVVLRGRRSVALSRLLARTDPRLVITTDSRRAWRISLGASPGLERYDGPR